MRPTSVLHIIPGLTTGGAEMMLVKLTSALSRSRFKQSVISLKAGGALRSTLERGVETVWDLGLQPGGASPAAIARLARLARKAAPDVIQGWMYHGNAAACVAAVAVGAPMVWGIHNTLLASEQNKRLTRLIDWAGARLSRWPQGIHYVSRVSADEHEGRGYAKASRTIIPIGFDCDVFAPRPAVRRRVRKHLGYDDDTLVVGCVARHQPMKDYRNLLFAAARYRYHHRGKRVRWLLIGPGVTDAAVDLRQLIAAHHLVSSVRLLGERPDVAELINAMDLFTLPSAYGEAFPNVVGEAMASGVPVVATRLGDVAQLVGETGLLVPPREPRALADAWHQLLTEAPDAKSNRACAARQRICEHFSLDRMASRFAALYEQVRANAAGCKQKDRRDRRCPEDEV